MGYQRPRTPRLGEKLRQIRKRLNGGLTQSEFVVSLGLEGDFDQERISKFERGVLEPPLYVLIRVCDLANIPLDVLARPEYDIPDELPVRTRNSGDKHTPTGTEKHLPTRVKRAR
jgi:transcriptional regulator with XRE-family HTH domain